MGKSLFIGCSHSMGYESKGSNYEFKIWQNNNYAEHYAKQNNKSVVIMASSGMGNREIVNFMSHAFKEYDDIDEVFVQATYWGRFPLAVNPDLNYKDIFPLDFFIDKTISEDLIDRWELGLVQPDFLGQYAHAYYKPESTDYDEYPYITETSPMLQPNPRTSSFMYVYMYHYLNTHLEQQDYMKDLALCDTLCSERNIPLYWWNINDRIFIPKKEAKNYYKPLQNTIFADTDAISFLNNMGINNLEKQKVDHEHYDEFVHSRIAKHYIPHLKTLRNNCG